MSTKFGEVDVTFLSNPGTWIVVLSIIVIIVAGMNIYNLIEAQQSFGEHWMKWVGNIAMVIVALTATVMWYSGKIASPTGMSENTKGPRVFKSNFK